MPLTLANRPWRASSLPRRGLLASVLSGMEPLACWRGLSKVIELFSSGARRMKIAMSVAAVSAATLAGELGREGQPRGAFVQHQNRLGAPAEHQIGLPVAELLAILDDFGLVVDPPPCLQELAIRDRAPGFAPFASASASLAARQQPPERLDLLPRPIAEAVDGLGTEPAQARLLAIARQKAARSICEAAMVRRQWRARSARDPAFGQAIDARSSRSSNASRSRRTKAFAKPAASSRPVARQLTNRRRRSPQPAAPSPPRSPDSVSSRDRSMPPHPSNDKLPVADDTDPQASTTGLSLRIHLRHARRPSSPSSRADG